MKEKCAVALLVFGFLITLMGVAQAQEVIIAPSSEPQVPMEILIGVMGRYMAMAQQYQNVIAQGGEPETAIQFRLAAKVVMGDELTDSELEAILTQLSEMAFWIRTSVFGRHTDYFNAELTGSLGDIELISTPDGAFIISRDEAVFARLATGEDIEDMIGVISVGDVIPETFVGVEPDFFTSLELLEGWFGRILAASASQLSMEYDGLESTSKGMAHVVRLLFTETGEIISLWVLDETWELCKIGIDDPMGGGSTLVLIEEVGLVTSFPDSIFVTDIAGLAELPQDQFLALVGMKVLTVVLTGPPVVADLSLSPGEVHQGEQVVIRSDGLDVEDEESELIPQMEYRAPNGSWTPLTASYVGVAPFGHWQNVWVPPIDGLPGSYDFRVTYTDSDGGISDPLELPAALSVIAAPPQVAEVNPGDQAEGVSVSSQIIVTFSQGMDKASVESVFVLTDAEGQTASGTFEWTDDTLIFTPDQSLVYGQRHSMKVHAAASGLNTATLGDDFVWSFTTEYAPAPGVETISPEDNQRDVTVSAQVSATLPVFVPKVSRLHRNYPNPFNPETWIPYQLAGDANVVIRIYSATGRLVRTLDMGYKTAGRYVSRTTSAHWDGVNEAGERVASGIYYYNIRAGAFSATRKMVITD